MYNETTVSRLRSYLLGALVFCACAGVDQSVQAQSASKPLPPKSLRDQMAEDLTPVPDGMGAIFVPTLFKAEYETGVVVYSNGERVASGPTAKRLPLPPGQYKVVVGVGGEGTRSSREVRVEAGSTTPVKNFFAGLRLFVVNVSGERVDATYEVTTEQGDRVLSEDFFADKSAQPTHLLAPGHYFVSIAGADEKERFAVTLHAGELLRYQILLDEDVAVGTTFGEPKPKRNDDEEFYMRWILGGTGAFDHRSDTVTGFNGDMVMIDLFAKATMEYENGSNLLRVNLFIDQGFGGIDNANGADSLFRWLNSRSELEAVYAYKVLDSPIAPYIRGIGRTSIAPTHYLPADDLAVVTQDADGQQLDSVQRGRGDRVELLPVFSPLSAQEGVGLGLELATNRYLTLELRGGAAARQAVYHDGSYIVDVDDSQLTLRRFADNNRWGGELTAVAELRLSRRLSIQSRFDSFIPSAQIFDDDKLKPVFYFDNTLAVSLGQWASVVYDLSFTRVEVVVPQVAIRSGLAVRLQHEMF